MSKAIDTPPHIHDGNRIIAEFMQLKKCLTPQKDKYGYTQTVEGFMYGQMEFPADELKYHTSWKWLMEAVEKIETLSDPHHGRFGVHIHSNACDIQGTNLHRSIQDSTYGYVYMSDPNAILNTKKESVWHNVVEFIKWHNTHLKK